jgi:DNA modification methylase
MKLGKYEIDKIYNEDCYQAIKNIPDKSIDLVYVDIPYEVVVSGGGIISKKMNSVSYNRLKKETSTICSGIDYSILDEYVRVLRSIYIYIWCSKQQVFDLMKFFIEKHHCYYNILFLAKQNFLPIGNSSFMSDKEICLCFYEDTKKFNQGYENKFSWYLGSTQDSRKISCDFYHPTIKPLEFVKQNILNVTQEGDIVLDTFMGSGTTAIACRDTNRHFLGFEINKEYWKTACNRLINKTRDDIEKEKKGYMSLLEEEN